MRGLIVRLALAAAMLAGLAACANDPGPSAYQEHGLYYYWNTDV